MSNEFDEADEHQIQDDNDLMNDQVEDEREFEDDDNEDPFVNAGSSRNRNAWISGGIEKNEIVRELIKYFSCMIESSPKLYAIPDHNGRYKPEDMKYEKLLDASKYVLRARRYLF